MSSEKYMKKFVVLTLERKPLGTKVARTQYYWLTLKGDYMEFVKKCHKCQRYINLHKVPPVNLHLVSSP